MPINPPEAVARGAMFLQTDNIWRSYIIKLRVDRLKELA